MPFQAQQILFHRCRLRARQAKDARSARHIIAEKSHSLPSDNFASSDSKEGRSIHEMCQSSKDIMLLI